METAAPAPFGHRRTLIAANQANVTPPAVSRSDTDVNVTGDVIAAVTRAASVVARFGVLLLGADVEIVDVLVEKGERRPLLRLESPAREHRIVEGRRADEAGRRRRHAVATQQHVGDLPVAETCRRVRYGSVSGTRKVKIRNRSRLLGLFHAWLLGSNNYRKYTHSTTDSTFKKRRRR